EQRECVGQGAHGLAGRVIAGNGDVAGHRGAGLIGRKLRSERDGGARETRSGEQSARREKPGRYHKPSSFFSCSRTTSAVSGRYLPSRATSACPSWLST